MIVLYLVTSELTVVVYMYMTYMYALLWYCTAFCIHVCVLCTLKGCIADTVNPEMFVVQIFS